MRDTLTAALRLSAVAATLAMAAPNTATAATSHWTLHRVPVEGEAVLTRVAAPTRIDAWAVGFGIAETGFSSLALRWDGKAWSKEPIPDLGRINDVAATSSEHAWAVGTVQTPGAYGGWIQRRDGTRWRSTPTTGLGDFYWFEDVAVRDRQDAWVVGAEVTPSHEERGIVLRWDGRQWSRTTVPDGSGQLDDTALDRGTLWAVGYAEEPTLGPYALRWTGTRWVTAQVPPILGGTIGGVAAIPGGGLWAAATRGEGDDSVYPVIAHHY